MLCGRWDRCCNRGAQHFVRLGPAADGLRGGFSMILSTCFWSAFFTIVLHFFTCCLFCFTGYAAWLICVPPCRSRVDCMSHVQSVGRLSSRLHGCSRQTGSSTCSISLGGLLPVPLTDLSMGTPYRGLGNGDKENSQPNPGAWTWTCSQRDEAGCAVKRLQSGRRFQAGK